MVAMSKHHFLLKAHKMQMASILIFISVSSVNLFRQCNANECLKHEMSSLAKFLRIVNFKI